MTVQLVVRVSDKTAAEIDELVTAGIAGSRSDAVRCALERFIDEERRRRVGRAIVEGYNRMPQTEEELARIDIAAAGMIAQEPW